jgi:predicted Zn-dependent protease
MKSRNNIRFLFVGSLVATIALIATVPFNMGGCNASNINVAGMIDAGKKAVKAESLNQRQERAIGESVSLAATNRDGVTKDQKLAQYVVLIGQTLASRTDRADQPWVFGVLDTDKVNAFSGPGGYVWVTRGAIAKMQDESELAGVLAHEIGHVVKHHGLDAAKNAGRLDALATAAQSSDSRAAALGNVSDKVVEVILNTGFSQPQEFEADAEAVKIVAAAGYDPNGYLNFLTRIRDQQKSGQQVFGTHPGTDDRIKKIKNQISAAGTAGKGATLKDRFASYTGRGTAVGSVDVLDEN